MSPDLYMEYDPVYGVARETYRSGFWNTGIGESRSILYRHVTVFESGERLGHWWVYDVNVEDGVSTRNFFDNNFVNGSQADLGGGRIRFVSGQAEAEAVAQRNGKHFYLNTLQFERRNRFTPVEWRDYRGNSPQEFFDKHANEHSRNNAIYNLFLSVRERGIYKPLIVIVELGIALVTILLPLALLLFTRFLSIFNRKSRKVSIAYRSGKDNNFNPGEQEIRARVTDINRHLNLVGSFEEYLEEFYQIKTKGPLLRKIVKFYPKMHPKRNDVADAFKRLKFDIRGREGKVIDNNERYEFIERWFVKPVAFLIIAILATTQYDKWDNYNKGKVDRETGRKYPPFRDQDLRRLFEFITKDGKDPIVELNLHWLLTVDVADIKAVEAWTKVIKNISEEEILGATDARQAVEDYKKALAVLGKSPANDLDKSRKVRIEQIREKWEISKVEEALNNGKEIAKNSEDISGNKQPEDNLLISLRRRLIYEYKKRGFFYPIFPLPIMRWGRIYGIISTVAGVLFASVVGLLPYLKYSPGFLSFHTAFLGFTFMVAYVLISDGWKMAKYVDFYRHHWFKDIWRIMKSSSDSSLMNDAIYKEKLKDKRSLFYRYFFWLGLSNILLWLGSLYYGASLWAAVITVPGLLLFCLSLFSLARASANKDEGNHPLSVKVYNILGIAGLAVSIVAICSGVAIAILGIPTAGANGYYTYG